FVAEHVIPHAARCSEPWGVPHVVIGGTYEVPGVALLDQFCDGTRRGKWNVIGVRLHGQQYFASVRRSFGLACEVDLTWGILSKRPSSCCVRQGCTGQHGYEEVTSLEVRITARHGVLLNECTAKGLSVGF